jgi:hypothetical protein
VQNGPKMKSIATLFAQIRLRISEKNGIQFNLEDISLLFFANF